MKMKMKRLFGILLSLVMVIGLMPGMSLTAYAKEVSGSDVAVDTLDEGDVIKAGATIVPGVNSYDDSNDPYGKPFYYLYLDNDEIATGNDSIKLKVIGQYSVTGSNYAITGFSPEIDYTVTRVYKPGGYNFLSFILLRLI